MAITRQIEKTLITGLAVVPRAKFNRIQWNESRDPRHAFYRLYRYASEEDADDNVAATIFGPILETFFKDDDDLGHGEEFWYRVADVDKGDDEGDLSDPASLEARGVQAADVEPKAITPDKYATNPAGNLVVDYEMTDPALWSFREFTAYSGGTLPTAEVDAVPIPDAQVTHEINPTVDDYGPSDWRFIAEVSEPQSALIFETGVSMPVDPGERFRASVLLEVLDTDATHYANNATLYLQYFRLDAAGVAEYVSTATVDAAGLSVPAGAPQKVRLSAVVTAPAGVSYATLYVKVLPTVLSPSPYTIRALIASPSLRHTAQVSDFAQVVSYFNGATNVTFGSGAGGAQIALVDIEAGPYDNHTAKSGIFTISFRNNSGSAITVGLEINHMLGGSVPATLLDIPAVAIGSGAMFSYTYRHTSAISRSTDDTIEARLYGSASGNSVHEISFVADMRQ